MRRLPFVLLTILALVLPNAIAASDNRKPAKSTTPLSADEIAIYKAVLRTYSDGKDESLNISARTYPLDPSARTTGFDQAQCLNGIQLENLSAVSHSYH